MYKKILDALKAKFEGVSETILGRIATKLAKTTTTEDDVQKAVGAYSFSQVLESYGDSRATEAQQTAVSNYEKKHGIKDGKLIEEGATKPQETTQPNSELQKALAEIEEIKAQMQQQAAKAEGERVAAARRAQLDSAIASLPDALKKPYQRINLDGSEEDFTKVLGDVTAEVETLSNELKSQGAIFTAPRQGGGSGEELTEEQLKAITKRDAIVGDNTQPF